MAPEKCSRCQADPEWYKGWGEPNCPTCNRRKPLDVVRIESRQHRTASNPSTSSGGKFVMVPRAAVLDPTLSWRAKVVLGVLCAHADNTTREARPSIERIASLAGVSRSIVDRGLRELRERSYISTTRRSVKGIAVSLVRL